MLRTPFGEAEAKCRSSGRADQTPVNPARGTFTLRGSQAGLAATTTAKRVRGVGYVVHFFYHPPHVTHYSTNYFSADGHDTMLTTTTVSTSRVNCGKECADHDVLLISALALKLKRTMPLTSSLLAPDSLDWERPSPSHASDIA
jgi:hypothetical protein